MRNFAVLNLAVLKIAVLAGSLAQAALPREKFQPAVNHTSASLDRTKEALDLPFANRVQVLREQGPEGYRNLRSIMFNPKARVDERWRSTMVVARLGGQMSLPELERATTADVWELRSAALIAASRIDRSATARWARRALSDKALLVRLTAVQTLDSIQAHEAVSDLWEQLQSPLNFKSNRSLFIRRRVVEALARLEKRGAEGRFVALLNDQDVSLHAPAIAAVEKFSGQKFGNAQDSLAKRRALCLQWKAQIKTL